MTDFESPNTETSSAQKPEIDYSPKEYSLKQLFLFGLIFIAAAAILLLPLIFYES